MDIQGYGKIQNGRRRKLKRRITGIIIAAVIVIIAVWIIGVLAQNSAEYQQRVSILEENHSLNEEAAELRQQVEDLQTYVETLQGQVSERDAYIASIPTDAPAETAPAQSEEPVAADEADNRYSVSPR